MLERYDYPDTDTTLNPVHFTRSGAATASAEFDQLLSAARPRLHRIARSRGLAHDAADDVAQETLVEAWRHLEQLRDPARFDAWLDGICRNVVRRRMRTAAQDARHEVPFSSLRQTESNDELDEPIVLHSADEQELDPAEVLSRQDLLTLLDQAMSLLPASTREALMLCYVDDVPQRELARQLGVSSNALDVRLHRARRQFRQILNNDLRAQAEAFGLLDTTVEAGWRETRLWCNFCGRQHLQGQFEFGSDGRTTLRMRCPECWARYHANSIQTSTTYLGQQPRTLLPAYKRFLQQSAGFYGDAVARGYRALCPDCRRQQVQIQIVRSIDVPTATYPGLQYFLYTCPACGIGCASISTVGIRHPVVRRFLADHPRSILEPEKLVQYAGRPAYRLCLTDVVGSAHLTAFADTETLAIFDITAR